MHAIDGTKFRNEFVDAQNQWYRELDGWRTRAGLHDLEALREQLRSAKQRYLDLVGDERRQIDDYRSKRREHQLEAYLEGFDLSRASIKGIGPAKLTTLSSFGIDTAADITAARLEIVPGFGDALIGRLIDWRLRQTRRFVYNASENEGDRREIARIRAIVESKAAQLRTTLEGGAHQLQAHALRLTAFAKKEDPLLAKVLARVEQAKADITFLGLPIPAVAEPPSSRRSPAPSQVRSVSVNAISAPIATRTSGIPSTPSRVPGIPSCPRCSSPMQQRLARQGRNAGNYFWGCSRYPSCKGTRPI
jgi:hypothetical protein